MRFFTFMGPMGSCKDSLPDSKLSYVFWQKDGGIHGIRAFWHFLSKPDFQKDSAWVPGDLFLVYEG